MEVKFRRQKDTLHQQVLVSCHGDSDADVVDDDDVDDGVMTGRWEELSVYTAHWESGQRCPNLSCVSMLFALAC